MNGITNGAKYGGAARGGDGIGETVIEMGARKTERGELEIEVCDHGRGLQGRTLEELSKEFSEVPAIIAHQDRARAASGADIQRPPATAGSTPTTSAFHNVRCLYVIFVFGFVYAL